MWTIKEKFVTNGEMVIVKKDCGNVPYKLILDFNEYLPPSFDFNYHIITLFNSFCSSFVEP